jgi:hypothetical protein
MITLFRKMRKRLMAERKFVNYLAYAIGEIVLIVIGILIALGINNWNQERQLQDKEQFYLSGLKTEFEISKTKLDTLIKVNRQSCQNARELITLLSGELPPEEKALSLRLNYALSSEIDYNPNNSLLNELINSGNLQNISNPELRKHLTAWASWLQSIHRQEQNLRDQRDHLITLFRTEEASLSTLLAHSGISLVERRSSPRQPMSGNMAILRSNAFENNLLLFILTGMATETNHHIPLKKEIERILALIEAEIEN